MTYGLDVTRLICAVQDSPKVLRDRRRYERQRKQSVDANAFPQGQSYKVFGEWKQQAGQARGHYFHQDLVVAREVYARKPNRHVDVGSSVYGFVSHVATFRHIDVMDVRPLSTTVDGITFIQADLMADNVGHRECTDSLSCLHALEHFGLGRYGDTIDYQGWRRGLQNLTSMLKTNGTLYLSVPSGQRQRVEFNAHRIFSIPFMRQYLEHDYIIERVHFVDDRGDLHSDIDVYSAEAERTYGADYGCSIWILRKR